MTEELGIRESIEIEVTRASPTLPSVPNISEISQGSAGAFLVLIALVVFVFLFALALKKHRRTRRSSVTRIVESPGYSGDFLTFGKKGLLRSLALAFIFGFVSFLFSGHASSWVLAVLIFYYEIRIKSTKKAH